MNTNRIDPIQFAGEEPEERACDFPACAVHHICTKPCRRNKSDALMIAGWLEGVGSGVPLMHAIRAARELRRIDALNETLAHALTQVLKHFPTDDDMASAGWAPSDVEEACAAYEIGRAAIKQVSQP